MFSNHNHKNYYNVKDTLKPREIGDMVSGWRGEISSIFLA
jgi:hypothetical protein